MLRIDAATGEVRVGPRERLGRDRLRVADVRWLARAAAGAAPALRGADPPPRRARRPPGSSRRDDGATLVAARRAGVRRRARAGGRVLRRRRRGPGRRLDSRRAERDSAGAGDGGDDRLGGRGVAVARADGVDGRLAARRGPGRCRGSCRNSRRGRCPASPRTGCPCRRGRGHSSRVGTGGGPGEPVSRPRRRASSASGSLAARRDLAAVEPEAAALRAEIDLQPLEQRLVEDRVALHAADVGRVRHGRDTSSPMTRARNQYRPMAGLPELEARLGLRLPRPGAGRDGADAQVLAQRGAGARARRQRAARVPGRRRAGAGGERPADAPPPRSAEGDLTKARAALVSEAGLARAAARSSSGG